MSNTITVEVARYADRDLLLEVLSARGYDARALDGDGHLGIELPCDDDAALACDDLFEEMEHVVGELEMPLVPVRGDGFVFLRPPGD